jgi:hypothetical protein
MLFFQVVLFAGYAYTHLLTHLPRRWQGTIHVTLVLAAAATLPVAPGAQWNPPAWSVPRDAFSCCFWPMSPCPTLCSPARVRWCRAGIVAAALRDVRHGGSILLWILLPAAASALLLASTNHLCQDVAVIPFLLVVPLSL